MAAVVGLKVNRILLMQVSSYLPMSGPDGVEPTLDVCRFVGKNGIDCTPIPKVDAARLRGNPKLQAAFLARARRSPTRAIRWLRRVSRPVRRRRPGSAQSLRRPGARQRRKFSAVRRSLGAAPASGADGAGDGDADGEPALQVALLERRLPCPLCGHKRKRIRRFSRELPEIAKPKPAAGLNIRLSSGPLGFTRWLRLPSCWSFPSLRCKLACDALPSTARSAS